MNVSEVMFAEAYVASQEETVQGAAQLARCTPAEISAGALQGVSDDDADDLSVASRA